MEFHEKLVELCRIRRMRRGAILEALNESGDPRLAASRATIGRWFSGRSEPSIRQLCFLACLFGTTVDAFCPGSGVEEPAGPDGTRSLNPEELLLITLARRLGLERALRRLLGVDADGQ
jgi:transcriptional regulator with XRE-family HTH domain